jgi:hypothetical protein
MYSFLLDTAVPEYPRMDFPIQCKFCVPYSAVLNILCTHAAIIFLLFVCSFLLETAVAEYPCVDFPIQSNFGSPYSASLSVFFDYDRMSQSQSDQALQQQQQQSH